MKHESIFQVGVDPFWIGEYSEQMAIRASSRLGNGQAGIREIHRATIQTYRKCTPRGVGGVGMAKLTVLYQRQFIGGRSFVSIISAHVDEESGTRQITAEGTLAVYAATIAADLDGVSTVRATR